jgi:hypothetical protein
MIWLIRKLFWFTLFLAATFGFLVLFEHGTDDYLKNASSDFKEYKKMFAAPPARKKDEAHKPGQ